MTTILAVYNSEGCVGRCDAQCHNAKHQDCSCICGGKNHGVGLGKAIENVRAGFGLRDEDLEKFMIEHGLESEELSVKNFLFTSKGS